MLYYFILQAFLFKFAFCDWEYNATTEFEYFSNQLLVEINYFRQRQNVSNLILSPEISNFTQSFSNLIVVNNNVFEEKYISYQGQELGELCVIVSGNMPKAEDVVRIWSTPEESDYFLNNGTYSTNIFSQLAWGDTKEVGFGISKVNDVIVIIASFYPKSDKRGHCKRYDNQIDKIQLMNEILTQVNNRRAKYSIAPMLLDNNLCSIAQDWANILASIGSVDSSQNTYQGQKLGEITTKFSFKDQDMSSICYSVKPVSRLDHTILIPVQGLFDDLIWKDSSAIGFGITQKGFEYYLVVNYFPDNEIITDNFTKLYIIQSRIVKSEPEVSKFANQTLNAINELRKYHRVSSLSLNNQISKIAQEYAKELCYFNKLEYSFNTYHGEDLGESIFMTNKSGLNGRKIARQWYNTKLSYNYNTNDLIEKARDFSQMVWKNTTEIGVGVARNNSAYCVVVNYYPAGNINKFFVENVFKPTD